MKKIILGKKEENTKYYFRETCFGIVYKNEKFYLTSKKGETSLIGGGLEKDEDHIECLKREFMEEAGLTITDYSEFITIDCFWVTRENDNMESLANFYIIDISDEIVTPTEEISKLELADKDEILSKLPLPYHKEAIRHFLKENNELED